MGPNSRAQRARLDMFEQMFSEPFYDTLRTKEQLGYSVHCSTRLTHGILGFAFVVISGGHACRFFRVQSGMAPIVVIPIVVSRRGVPRTAQASRVL